MSWLGIGAKLQVGGEAPIPAWFDDVLDELGSVYRGVCERLERGGKPLELHFGVRVNHEFNASAYSYGNAKVIVICVGAAWIAQGLFRVLLSQREFLPEVGDPAACTPHLFPGMTSIPLEGRDWKEIGPLACLERDRVATLLAKATIAFLAFHEGGHVLSGHIDYLRHYGVMQHDETAPEAGGGLTRQTLEWDADHSAVGEALQLVVQPRTDFVGEKRRWHLETPGWFGNPERSIGLLSVAIAMFFRCTSRIRKLRDPGSAAAKHPPSAFRQFVAISIMAEVLKVRAGWSPASTWAAVSSYMGQTSLALEAAFPATEWYPLELADFALIDDYNDRYRKEWERIRDEVAAFAYVAPAPAVSNNVPLPRN